MNALLPSIHIANRAFVDRYFNSTAISKVEALLRSIRPVTDEVAYDSKLNDLASSVARSQEEDLERNLEMVSFSIDSAEDASSIAGSGRVETVSHFHQ